MEIDFDKHIIVGALIYTQWKGKLPVFKLKPGGEKPISICFYYDVIVCVLEDSKCCNRITAELIKQLYDIGNRNINDKIRELFKKGIYKELFKGELKEWYMGIALGDAWS